MKSLLKENNQSHLKIMIENLRKEMIRIGIQEGLSSEKTIEISQKLDFYILKSMANLQEIDSF